MAGTLKEEPGVELEEHVAVAVAVPGDAYNDDDNRHLPVATTCAVDAGQRQ
jgi:hypothetical protein